MQFILRCKCLRLGVPNNIISLLFIVLFAAAANAAEVTEPSKKLTLRTALSLALQANPSLAVAKREREAIEGVKIQADVRPNPTVSTSIQDTRSDTRQIFLQINQEIELGDKRNARIEAADSVYNKATAELEHQVAEVHANVVAAFYEVLAAQARLGLAQSSAEVAALALDAAVKRVKAGKSSPVEETKSKIAESAIKIEFMQVRSQLNSSRQRLSALWGNASPAFESAEGEVAVIPLTASLNALSALLANAPAINAAKIEVNRREMMTNVERTKVTPNITISAGVVNNQEVGLNQALLGLTVPIPLSDRNQGNLQEAIARQYKAQDELIALENQLQSNLAGQYERLSAAKQSATLLSTEILPGAQSAFDAANKGFTAGKFSFLDVLDAQRTLFQAKSQHIQVLLEAHQAVAEIERILGDVISHPEH